MLTDHRFIAHLNQSYTNERAKTNNKSLLLSVDLCVTHTHTHRKKTKKSPLKKNYFIIKLKVLNVEQMVLIMY